MWTLALNLPAPSEEVPIGDGSHSHGEIVPQTIAWSDAAPSPGNSEIAKWEAKNVTEWLSKLQLEENENK